MASIISLSIKIDPSVRYASFIKTVKADEIDEQQTGYSTYWILGGIVADDAFSQWFIVFNTSFMKGLAICCFK